MSRRGDEAPMDFEYHNRTGPIGDSPFGALAWQSSQQGGGRKRDFTAFNSPVKNAPSSHQPASSWKTNAGVWGPNNPLFSTPRKLDDNNFNSSDPDTPDTPANAFDSEAPTPETNPMRRKESAPGVYPQEQEKQAEPGASKPSIKNGGRRDSWFSRFTWNSSPVNRSSYREKKMVRKRNQLRVAKAHESRKAVMETDYSSESDTGTGAVSRFKRTIKQARGKSSRGKRQGEPDIPRSPDGKHSRDSPGGVYGFFSFIDSHPDLPHTLSYYVQFIWNFFVVGFLMYIVWSFWATIISDVDQRSEAAMVDIIAEMRVCAQAYRENRCERETRVPAMEIPCTEWEKCMNKDPRSVGRARVSAHTFAEIFNSFVEPISYKTMLFTAIIALVTLGIPNYAFGMFRTKYANSHPGYGFQPHHYGIPPPATPQRIPSNQGGGDNGIFYTPYTNMQPLEPSASQAGWTQPNESPVRKLQFR